MGWLKVMLLSEVAKTVDGELIGNDLEISTVSIDTRTIVKNALYIAIKGKNLDGHNFIDKAENAGANSILVEHKVETKLSQEVDLMSQL